MRERLDFDGRADDARAGRCTGDAYHDSFAARVRRGARDIGAHFADRTLDMKRARRHEQGGASRWRGVRTVGILGVRHRRWADICEGLVVQYVSGGTTTVCHEEKETGRRVLRCIRDRV